MFKSSLLFLLFLFAIELEKKTVLDGKVEIMLPKDWKPMSDELIGIKYPGPRPPKLVYSDKTGGISVAFNHTESKATAEALPQFKDVLIQSLKTAYPDAKWEEEGMKEINGKKAGFCKLITETANGPIYNYMIFTDLDGRLLIASFNCIESKLKDWKPVAEQIMGSITVK